VTVREGRPNGRRGAEGRLASPTRMVLEFLGVVTGSVQRRGRSTVDWLRDNFRKLFALLLVLIVGITVGPPVVGLLRGLSYGVIGCPPAALRMVAEPETILTARELAAAYEQRTAADDYGCPTARIYVFPATASTVAGHLASIDGRSDDSQALSQVGPRPDVLLYDSERSSTAAGVTAWPPLSAAEIERRLDSVRDAADLPIGDAADLLCRRRGQAARDAGSPAPAAIITSEQEVARYNDGLPLGASCGAPPRRSAAVSSPRCTRRTPATRTSSSSVSRGATPRNSGWPPRSGRGCTATPGTMRSSAPGCVPNIGLRHLGVHDEFGLWFFPGDSGGPGHTEAVPVGPVTGPRLTATDALLNRAPTSGSTAVPGGGRRRHGPVPDGPAADRTHPADPAGTGGSRRRRPDRGARARRSDRRRGHHQRDHGRGRGACGRRPWRPARRGDPRRDPLRGWGAADDRGDDRGATASTPTRPPSAPGYRRSWTS
jgi:hypothetical protein